MERRPVVLAGCRIGFEDDNSCVLVICDPPNVDDDSTMIGRQRSRWFIVLLLLSFLSRSTASTASLLSLTSSLPSLIPALLATAMSLSKTDMTLEQLGITLPPAPKPAANYLPCQRVGNILYLSGHLPLRNDGSLVTGVISAGSTDDERQANIDHGYQAARQVGLNLIATLKQELDGDLDRVEQIVKLFGIVQSSGDFHSQHLVVNGCSDLMCQVFGKERGLHARSAIGTNALPLDISVEIEAIVRVRDGL